VILVTNAVTEALNSRIQWIKHTARGFRCREGFRRAVYFHCAALELYPQSFSKSQTFIEGRHGAMSTAFAWTFEGLSTSCEVPHHGQRFRSQRRFSSSYRGFDALPASCSLGNV
jgi:hypothetical protein